MRLKIASIKFIVIIMEKIFAAGAVINDEERPRRNKTEKITARSRFDAGPARATIAGPHLPARRLYGLKGTGLAQPITNPPKK